MAKSPSISAGVAPHTDLSDNVTNNSSFILRKQKYIQLDLLLVSEQHLETKYLPNHKPWLPSTD